MALHISENIISEGGLTASTLTSDIISATTLSATTLYGDGSNITNITTITSPGGPNNSIQFNNSTVLSGSSSLLYSGDTLFFTGTTNTDGQFFYGGNSAELRLQWFGAQAAGTAPGIIWTNMPLGITTWLHQTSGTLTGDATYIVDLTEYTQLRFFFAKLVGGAAPSNLGIQYSFNNSTWEISPLVTLAVGTGTGFQDTGWITIPVAARTIIYIRLIGAGGNGNIDPRFSPPTILFR